MNWNPVWIYQSFISQDLFRLAFFNFLYARLIIYWVQRLIVFFDEYSWILGSLQPTRLNVLSKFVLILIFWLSLYFERLNPLVANLWLFLQVLVFHLPCLARFHSDWGALNFLWRYYHLCNFDLKDRELFKTIKQLLHNIHAFV